MSGQASARDEKGVAVVRRARSFSRGDADGLVVDDGVVGCEVIVALLIGNCGADVEGATGGLEPRRYPKRMPAAMQVR